MTTGVSAYVPCFNNRATLAAALQSVQAQTSPVAELFVVDDGSTDGSPDEVERLGVRVIRLGQNFGRGAARARAMQTAQHGLVLCCDATNTLPPDFVARAVKWFAEPQVAAVFGRVRGAAPETVMDRWRTRHLFKSEAPLAVNRRATLATYGTMVRKSAALAVGNYDAALRHSEDAELGGRLLARGFDVVFDPELHALASARSTFAQLMERYWRWHAGQDESASWKAYLKQVSYSFKVMAREDLRAGDPLSVPVSLFSPHYQFWRSWWRGHFRRAGAIQENR